jgi:ABC-2 type transport system ATP-binding protein
MIKVNNISKTYKIKQKSEGLKGSIKHLFSTSYTDIEALKDVSFTIKEGSFTGLIGSNGAGKTTLLKILSGILYPTEGEATVDKHIPWKRKNEFKRNIAILMGNKGQLLWDLPAVDSFRINKEIYDVADKEYNEFLDEITSVLRVKDKLNIQVRRLSLGERMKMEIIAALIHKPKVIFLDEPTLGLDIFTQREIRLFLKKLNEKEKTTIILTSHYMNDIIELCNDLIIINKGEVKYDGLIKDIFLNFSHRKQVKFHLEEEISKEDLKPYGDIASYEEKTVKYNLKEQDALQYLCQSFLAKYKITDMTVEDTPIEDVLFEMLG